MKRTAAVEGPTTPWVCDRNSLQGSALYRRAYTSPGTTWARGPHTAIPAVSKWLRNYPSGPPCVLRRTPRSNVTMGEASSLRPVAGDDSLKEPDGSAAAAVK